MSCAICPRCHHAARYVASGRAEVTTSADPGLAALLVEAHRLYPGSAPTVQVTIVDCETCGTSDAPMLVERIRIEVSTIAVKRYVPN